MKKTDDKKDKKENSDLVTINEFKEHLGLEGIDVSEGILNGCLLASIEYCQNHNETEYTKENLPHTVRLAILMLAAHYFNNREATTDTANKEISLGIKSLLNASREKYTC